MVNWRVLDVHLLDMSPRIARCASVGHVSSNCNLEQKCVNCSQPHSTDSKLCPKWKIEKEIQTIKSNKNIFYVEARKLITPQPSQTYAQVAKSITVNNSSQTDKSITKVKCPPLKLLQPLSSFPKSNTSISTPAIFSSSSSTQAQQLPSISAIPPVNPIPNNDHSTSNISAYPSSSGVRPSSSTPSIQDTKQKAITRLKKRDKS
ncbi:uncharacterized protein TNCV_4045261 [Trichonephila clavipes]|nr:uncharacterized protein TNCV_4045261 [Trichonephila clavipes]